MRVLVYNWRDIENPSAGGAEVFTHEVLKRLVDRGHQATLFTSEFDGAPEEEELDGVRIVRDGGRLSVYWKARRHYRRRFEGDFDVVIDEINTRPFMTSKFVEDVPIVALIHQLAREFWFYETPFPISHLGYYWLEERWLSRYTGVDTVTVSESTKRDLEELGFRNVTVVPEGLSVEPVDAVPTKADRPTFLYVGRMTAAKRPNHALDAFERIQEELPEARLQMVGDGYLLDELKARANGSVEFHGYVSESEKLELMKRSHVLLVPGVREGWGLVVSEANAMGTPAVGYDVPGLRDSITHGHTGLCTDEDPSSLARAAMELLSNGYRDYAEAALEHAGQFSWTRTADEVEAVLDEVIAEGTS